MDPAIYCGSPEIELAFGTLFGTFGEAFFEAYASAMPLEPGFHELRLGLYNLYPRLVHVRLFGSSYLAGIDATLARLGLLGTGQKRTGPDGPGRSSLRNEPSAKGMAFNSGLRLAPPSYS